MLATFLTTGGVLFPAMHAGAGAPGFNLSWGECGTTLATQDHAGSCEPGVTPPPLVVSFRTSTPIADFVAVSVVIDYRVEGTEMPSWSDWASGGDRSGALAIVPVETIATCVNPYQSATQGGGLVILEGTTVPGPNVRRIRADWARNSAAPIEAAPLYTAMVFQIAADGRRRSALPRTGFRWGVAPGCEAPACFVINSLELFGLSGSYQRLQTADLRGWVTWQASPSMSFPCPDALPTRRSTWGALKATYR